MAKYSKYMAANTHSQKQKKKTEKERQGKSDRESKRQNEDSKRRGSDSHGTLPKSEDAEGQKARRPEDVGNEGPDTKAFGSRKKETNSIRSC